MLIVNLYGAPGAGKSTGAAYIFSQLKMRGINAELVTEFAKDKVWEESKAVFQNQAYTYGSEEYNGFLKEMRVALQHHYANYRHHPEHFEHGIEDMTLIDIVEMLCDWKAASMRQNDGNLLKSIETNARRFGYDDQLKQILINTAKLFDEM